MLVNHGAKAEVAEYRFGCTPLHWAASVGDVDLCAILCSAGAKANTIDKSGFHTIAYARQAQKQECVDLLLSTSSSPAGMQEEKRAEDKLVGGINGNNNDDLEWEKLVDNSTGYIYYHNWKTGQSMWEDDYIIYKRSIAKGGLRPIASSFSNRPPPPSPGMKSFSLSSQSRLQIKETIDDIDARAQGKESRKIDRIDELDTKSQMDEEDEKEEDYPNDAKSQVEDKGTHDNIKRIGSEDNNIAHVADLKNILSDSDISSSASSSMIEYESDLVNTGEGVKAEQKTNNSVDDVSRGVEGTQVKENESLQIQIPTNPILLSPMSPVPPARKMVTQDSFNQRFTSLQSRMEDQLNQQLKKMEDKIKGVKNVRAQETNQNI
jgi:hypothetical protein